MTILRFLIAAACAVTALAEQPWTTNQLHYIDEIGHLGSTVEDRTSVRIGDIHIGSQRDGGVLIRGNDDRNRTWSAALDTEGGVGFTDVWRSDFDGNGRLDYLFAAYFPQNGRCVDRITLTFLLFDAAGRPVPWIVETRMPVSHRTPSVPAIFADLNRNGRPELVVTDCQYSDPPRVAGDRRITGIYEAHNATWSLQRQEDPLLYTPMVQRSHPIRPKADRILPAGRWLNKGNAIEPNPPQSQITAVLPAGGEARRNRFQLSNGTTCYDWPPVVLDRKESREIVASEHRRQHALQDLAENRRTVIVIGQQEADTCSPTLLWSLQD